MISKILRFFTGSVKIYADSQNRDAFISLLTERKIGGEIVPEGEEGGVSTVISPFLLKKIAPALDKSGIIVYIINICGLARLVSRYRARPGLFAGAFVFALVLWLSTLFVWRVDVDGTELLSKEQVREELAGMGVYPGCLISSVDKSSVSNRFLSLHPELSWAALNFSGTTVSLSVKETLSRPEDEVGDSALIVADRDGLISYIAVYEGSAAVKPGTVVKKGDVLISGFISGSGLQITDTPLLRMGNARGVVKAEISDHAEVTVPFTEVTETESGGKVCGRSISVFGYSIGVGKTEGIASGERNVTVFGAIELPITVRQYAEPQIRTETTVRTPDEATAEAERRAYARLSELTSDCELVSVKLRYTEDVEGITVRIDYVCIADIGVEKHVGTP